MKKSNSGLEGLLKLVGIIPMTRPRGHVHLGLVFILQTEALSLPNPETDLMTASWSPRNAAREVSSEWKVVPNRFENVIEAGPPQRGRSRVNNGRKRFGEI